MAEHQESPKRPRKLSPIHRGKNTWFVMKNLVCTRVGEVCTDETKKFIFIFHEIVKQNSEYFYFFRISTILYLNFLQGIALKKIKNIKSKILSLCSPTLGTYETYQKKLQVIMCESML